MLRSAAILLALSAAARADSTAPPEELRAFWPDAGRARFRVDVLGKFDTGGRDDVNRVNAPPIATRPPPLLDVPQLQAMNADLPRAVDDTLRALGLKRMHDDEQPACGEDFSLTIRPAPPNGLGGRHAGTDVAVWTRTLGCERADAFAFASVAIAADEKTQLAHVRAALRGAIVQALKELRAQWAKPLVDVELRFELANLDGGQRDFVRERVAPCAAALAEPVSHEPFPVESLQAARLVKLRLGRYAPQTEDQLLDWYASLLPSIALGKGRGCLERGPLAGWRVAAARKPPRTIVVSFSRP